MSATTSNRQSSEGDDRPAILIFGASARAAAQSARRAGLEPIVSDLFGDLDLHEAAQVLSLDSYPNGFTRVAKLAPPCPWLYTGGLENHAAIVDEIAEERTLWGNPGDVLKRVRDPNLVSDALRQAGLPAAKIRSADRPPGPTGDWLLKPTNGAGGGGIAVWDEATNDHTTLNRPYCFQERLEGLPISATFVATRNIAHLVGVTRQFVGTKSWGAAKFSYCGSLGPFRFSAAQTEGIVRIGRTLAEVFGLRGLFGVDLIYDGQSATPVEVNPRYVASIEVLERAMDMPLLEWHRRACESYEEGAGSLQVDDDLVFQLAKAVNGRQEVVGKAILFARDDLICPPFKPIRKALPRDGC
ncbi:MAG: ATP-grasp domain-containing protein, partial [Planctomycetaceae bacterium]|nr:ATP-grasp domain-containing protein [Planctomycetaceae bacterium]